MKEGLDTFFAKSASSPATKSFTPVGSPMIEEFRNVSSPSPSFTKSREDLRMKVRSVVSTFSGFSFEH